MDTNALLDQIGKLSERERRLIASWMRRSPVARDVNREFRAQFTLGDRVADRVAEFGGSWTFIFLFIAGMAVWMLINMRSPHPVDPFPFILLNLILSCLAALQAPVIMMSQNRQSDRDRLDAHNDYEVNTKAEMEIMALHNKLDQLRDPQWAELLTLQQRQVELLEEIHQKM